MEFYPFLQWFKPFWVWVHSWHEHPRLITSAWSDPTAFCTSSHHSLRSKHLNQGPTNWLRGTLTKAIPLITRAPTLCPHVIIQRTVAPIIMLVSNVFKEMNLIFPREYPGSNAVHRCIPPTLDHERKWENVGQITNADLVIEPACGIEVIEECSICRTSPEIHVCDFKVTPDYEYIVSGWKWQEQTVWLTVACIICLAAIMWEETHSVVGHNIFRVLIDEI
jgi:hypothetical protein